MDSCSIKGALICSNTAGSDDWVSDCFRITRGCVGCRRYKRDRVFRGMGTRGS